MNLVADHSSKKRLRKRKSSSNFPLLFLVGVSRGICACIVYVSSYALPDSVFAHRDAD